MLVGSTVGTDSIRHYDQFIIIWPQLTKPSDVVGPIVAGIINNLPTSLNHRYFEWRSGHDQEDKMM
jgi:hypothetical protein